MNWFDKAAEELEEQVCNGEISNEEYRVEMRYLRDELKWQRDEFRQDAAYEDDGGW